MKVMQFNNPGMKITYIIIQREFLLVCHLAQHLSDKCPRNIDREKFCHLKSSINFFYVIHLFLEGKGGKREGENHQCVVAICVPCLGT